MYGLGISGRFLHLGQLYEEEVVSTSYHRFYTAVPAASHVPPPQDTSNTTSATHTTPTIPLPSSRTVTPVIASHNSTSTLNHLPGISTAPTVPSSKSQGTVINTDYGNFRGKPADKGAEAWLGIPFAAVRKVTSRRGRTGARELIDFVFFFSVTFDEFSRLLET